MSGSSPPPLSSLLTYDKSEPPLAEEMWGLLKALATQLHVNVEPAAPSSSSTAMEPSPAQGNRRKDKAPMSPEDSEDDNKDISKSIPGGKSLSLVQGLALSYTMLALSTPGPSCCPTCMRILSGQSGRYQLVPTAPSPQMIMQNSPRRISSMSLLSTSSSRPYAQHSSYALAWQRMVSCWWTSTPSLSPSSTPCSCS